MNPTNPPAFPTARVTINGINETDGVECYGPGMTLRDYFAAKAMQGDHANSGVNESDRNCAFTARKVYAMADAMMIAREAK